MSASFISFNTCEDNTDSECLNTIRFSLENAAGYAGMNYMITAGEIVYYFNEISERDFYPLVQVLHYQSNSIQWSIVNALRSINPVTNMSQLIERLETDYATSVLMYELAISESTIKLTNEFIINSNDFILFLANLQDELNLALREFNTVKSSIFPTFNSVKSYFLFTANYLADALNACVE
jgi:hypothetical protein